MAVEKVDAALGEGGSRDPNAESMVVILAVPGDWVSPGTGLRLGAGSGKRSAWGTGRRRLSIEDAADMGSATNLCFGTGVIEEGSGGGGEGGGEC